MNVGWTKIILFIIGTILIPLFAFSSGYGILKEKVDNIEIEQVNISTRVEKVTDKLESKIDQNEKMMQRLELIIVKLEERSNV